MIAASFSVMAAYYKIETLYAFVKTHARLNWLELFYRFMTRHRNVAT